jgi:hypothetical protein
MIVSVNMFDYIKINNFIKLLIFGYFESIMFI